MHPIQIYTYISRKLGEVFYEFVRQLSLRMESDLSCSSDKKRLSLLITRKVVVDILCLILNIGRRMCLMYQIVHKTKGRSQSLNASENVTLCVAFVSL